MDKYVSTIDLECNAQRIDDFNSFTEDARVLRRPVRLIKKTGVMGVTPRYGFRLNYVVPLDKPEFDFENLEDGTVTVQHENGRRTTFTGVYCIEIGEEKIDGENEVVKEISCIAGDRVKE